MPLNRKKREHYKQRIDEFLNKIPVYQGEHSMVASELEEIIIPPSWARTFASFFSSKSKVSNSTKDFITDLRGFFKDPEGVPSKDCPEFREIFKKQITKKANEFRRLALQSVHAASIEDQREEPGDFKERKYDAPGGKNLGEEEDEGLYRERSCCC